MLFTSCILTVHLYRLEKKKNEKVGVSLVSNIDKDW